MEEQENNNNLADFLEVLQDQHREIKNISGALERIGTAENPTANNINRLAKEMANIKSGLQDLKKGNETISNFGRVTDKIDLLLDITRAERTEYAQQRKPDILIKIRSRKLIISVAVSLLLAVLGLALWIKVWRENRSLTPNDLKYRYYKITTEGSSLIDSLFQVAPGDFKAKVEEMEYNLMLTRELERLKRRTIQDSVTKGKKKRKTNY